MDMICQRVLNQGFLKVERYHSLCQRQVKAQLPRWVRVREEGRSVLSNQVNHR